MVLGLSVQDDTSEEGGGGGGGGEGCGTYHLMTTRNNYETECDQVRVEIT